METIEELRDPLGRLARDGAELPEGPWHAEPDRLQFEHEGFPCLIVRGRMGNLCGYVGVPPGHPWHRREYEGIEAKVHGGLTYAAKCSGWICHIAKPGEPDDVWWLGFDCAHSGDLIPGMYVGLPGLRHEMRNWETYKDVSYVRAETQRLAEQAKTAAQ
jgi:hypothetical protein